jgi:hypothetical protein
LLIIPKQARIRRTADKEIISQNNDDLDELDPNYRYIRSSKSPGPNINIIQSNIYNIASLAYLNSLNQGANIDFNFKNRENHQFNDLNDLRDFSKIVKDDDFDDLLIFNLNINEKSIFEENMNTSHVNFYNYKNRNLSINSSFKNNYNFEKVDKIDKDDKSVFKDKDFKIEIKDLIEPKSYKEAINTLNKDEWIKSMKLELDTLNNNNTWELVLRPKNTKVLKSRWVYKIKDIDTLSPIFKSRFVAKGFEQLYGLNYIETYASVIKQIAWKLVFALAILNNLIIFKADMISAFT